MVTRSELEAKAKEIEGALQQTQEAAKSSALWAAVGIAAIVAIAFIVGRRRGDRSKAVVKVYRT